MNASDSQKIKNTKFLKIFLNFFYLSILIAIPFAIYYSDPNHKGMDRDFYVLTSIIDLFLIVFFFFCNISINIYTNYLFYPEQNTNKQILKKKIHIFVKQYLIGFFILQISIAIIFIIGYKMSVYKITGGIILTLLFGFQFFKIKQLRTIFVNKMRQEGSSPEN